MAAGDVVVGKTRRADGWRDHEEVNLNTLYRGLVAQEGYDIFTKGRVVRDGEVNSDLKTLVRWTPSRRVVVL